MNHELENGNWVDLRYGSREYYRFFGGASEADVYSDGSFYNQLVAEIETDLGIKLSVRADADEPDIQLRWMGAYYDIWICAKIYDRYLELHGLLQEPETEVEAALQQIARDLEKCDLAIALLSDGQALQSYIDQRPACYAEIQRLNKLQGLDTAQTDSELLAELGA